MLAAEAVMPMAPIASSTESNSAIIFFIFNHSFVLIIKQHGWKVKENLSNIYIILKIYSDAKNKCLYLVCKLLILR